MHRLFVLVMGLLFAQPALTDPLDLIDYARLFEENADAVEAVSEDRRILEMSDITLLHDPTEPRAYTGIDQSGQGAVGCFVTILATIESSLQACETELTEAQKTIQSDYLSRALAFYAENTVPPATAEQVRAGYNALVSFQVEEARPFCADISMITSLADRLFDPSSAAEVDGMLATPRLPVENPCL